MRVHAKFGCLQDSRVVSGTHVYNGPVTIEKSYATTMLKFDRPENGTTEVDIVCPVCGNPVALNVVSASRIQLIYQAGAVLAIALVAVLGWMLFKHGVVSHPAAPQVGQGLLVLSGIGLAVLLLLTLATPDLLDHHSSALSISADPASLQSGSGLSESKGHKLLEVWVK
jgi:hypothetical protein